MPGILPMKVIKVGNSAQSRIAQACDRCRSKKIRCDGVRPTCSQCATVGFECRTSDKLSRRAFPRGYTESLEERVRALETEVRELKDLLDEKDEKIDMLSKLHGNRRRGSITSQSSGSPTTAERTSEPSPAKEDTFRVQASPLLLGVENSDSFFMGPSSGRAFIEVFKRRIQEAGKACSDFNPEAFLHIQGTQPLIAGDESTETLPAAPPRLFSDRCVNVYFQEWAPLFPVLHKPTFLRIYEEFSSDPSKIKCNYKTAQLYLVFSIAGLSQDSTDLPVLAACEKQWTTALDSLLLENTMNTLQCLLLALIYCTMRADYKRLQHYKGIAVGLSHRLGLHQSQKRFSFGALTIETRKKVFWSLYTLDCFTAATLGLPKLLKEDDVQAEYPSDTDDEYVTEKGFQPTLPGESTRLSSALALFKASRILARVLEKNYPASPSPELSLQSMEALETELDAWYENLPSHLRLTFAQDKPSTDVTGSRSPLLALAYYFIRTLIYRPAVGSTLGAYKAAPALLSIADSSKHIVQIIQLLEERSMIFSFCLNRCDLLIVCGMTLLYRVIDLKQDGKLMRDDQKLINAAIKIVEKSKSAGAWDFKRIAGRLITLDEPTTCTRQQSSSRETSATVSRSPSSTQPRKKSPYINGRRPEAAVSESDLLQQQERMRRMTMPSLDGRPAVYRSASRQSFESLPTETTWQQQEQHINTANGHASHPNLDYLSLSNTPAQSRHPSPPHNNMRPPSSYPHYRHSVAHQPMTSKAPPTSVANTADWEVMLGTMDNGLNNVYDAIYGGPGFINEASVPVNGQHHQHTSHDWSPDSWDLSNFSIGEFGHTGSGANNGATGPAPPQSVLSLSDESLSSGEDVAPSELGLSMGSVADYQGTMISTGNDGFILDGLDGFPL